MEHGLVYQALQIPLVSGVNVTGLSILHIASTARDWGCVTLAEIRPCVLHDEDSSHTSPSYTYTHTFAHNIDIYTTVPKQSWYKYVQSLGEINSFNMCNCVQALNTLPEPLA